MYCRIFFCCSSEAWAPIIESRLKQVPGLVDVSLNNQPRGPAMGCGHLANNRQPQSRSVRATCYEWLEQLVADVAGWSGALVSNRQNQVSGFVTRGDQDPAFCRGGLDGIEDQVVDRAAHLIGVKTGLRFICLACKHDSLRASQLGMQAGAAIQEEAQCDKFAARLVAFGHRQQPP